MSQYPSPYQPPSQQYPIAFDYYQPGDVLGPNRSAAMLMFVVAGLTLIGGVCCAGLGAVLPRAMAERPDLFAEVTAQFPQFTPDVFRIMLIVFAVLMLGGAIGLIVLGVFVRRGSKAATVVSIVLVILALLYLLLNLVASLALGTVQSSQLAFFLCMMTLPIAVLGLLLVMLFKSVPSADQARAMRDQHMQQYWQYAYQQQTYSMQQQGQQQQQPTPPQPPPPQSGGPDAPPPTG